MDTLMDTNEDSGLLQLLQPLSEAEPCGPAMRHDAVFTEIRLAREEDDPSLPMGQWERPLKKADWQLIDRLCQETLSTRTKDLQLAAWLTEAWTRLGGFVGLARGMVLVRELLDRFWQPLHPRIEEDGDADARVAPLEWLNESMPLTLKVHVVLLTLTDRKPSRVSMADWERLTISELAGPAKGEAAAPPPGSPPPLTRQEVVTNVRRHGGVFVRGQLSAVRDAITRLNELGAFLDERLKVDAPNLGKLKTTLESIERVLAGLQTPATVSELTDQVEDKPTAAAAKLPEDRMMSTDAADLRAPESSAAPLIRSGWRSREEAYAVLESIAEYLGSIEPHSPTPYLIRRAVRWGRMPLPELMEEIVQEEGDLNQLFKLVARAPGKQQPY